MLPTVTSFVTSPRSKTVILRADAPDDGVVVITANRIGRVRTVQLMLGGSPLEQDAGVAITSLSIAGTVQSLPTLPEDESVTRVEGLSCIMALGQIIECSVEFPALPAVVREWGRFQVVVEFDELDVDVIGLMECIYPAVIQAVDHNCPVVTPPHEVFSDAVAKGSAQMQRIVRVPEWFLGVRVEPSHATIRLVTVAGIPVRWHQPPGYVDPSAWVVESPSAWSAPAGQKRLAYTGQLVTVSLDNPDECPDARAVFTVESLDPAAFSAELERIVSSVQ